MASDPLPEKGLTSTSFVSSVGIPRREKTGDSHFVSIAEIPLTSNNSVKIKMHARYGKSPTANGTALFAPSTNSSYGLTFLKNELIKITKISTGIRYAIYFLLTNTFTRIIPMTVDRRVVRIVGRIMSDGEIAFIDVRSARTDVGISCMLVALTTKNIVIA